MKHFKWVVAYITVLLTVASGYGFYNSANHKKVLTDSTKGFAIVELFTSEGCSSCPAADALAATISAENNKNIHFLSFHVDYWNQYGWKDIFSSNNYTVRQQQYAGFFKLKSIYTPQAVVNGRTEFVGSDERKLRSTIQRELKTDASTSINLQARTDSKTVTVTYTVSDAVNSILNIALVQKQAAVAVKRGENAGRMLKHTDIVRAFKKLDIVNNNPNTVVLYVPNDLLSKDLKLVAYVQNKDDYKVTGVVEKNL